MTKLALLTGGSRGIGRATADMLRARGWDVLAPTRAELDLSYSDAVERYVPKLMTAYDKNSPLNALVLCAGAWYSARMSWQKRIDFYRQFDFLAGHQQLIVGLRDRLAVAGGCVVGVSSTQAFHGVDFTAPYSVAKAAQINLISSYAENFGGGKYERIRFNSIAPGLTKTQMGEAVIASGGAKKGVVPQPPEAVAKVILRLIEGNYNGKIIRVVNSVATEASWCYNEF